MSYTELHIGKLIPTEFTKENVNDMFKQSEEFKKGWSFEDWYYDCNLFIHEETVYKIEDNTFDDSGIITGTKKEDGSIEYVSQFYNGGCGFHETLDDVVKKANETT